MEQMSCTARFIRPFVRLLAGYAEQSDLKLDRVQTIDPDSRVSLHLAYDTVQAWVKRTGDPNLGLKAGRNTCVGSAGALEFAMRSANTLREAIALGQRYHAMLSDALVPRLEITGNVAVIRLDNSVVWSRAVADFTMAVWYRNHVRTLAVETGSVECLFAHEMPDDLSEYRQCFDNATLTFGAGCYGFRLAAPLLDQPLASGDPLLHALHCEHLEGRHSTMNGMPSAALRVRELLASELRHGRPTATAVARRMNISRRTLVRHLERESTCFTAQLDALRHQLALGLVAAPELQIKQVTELLGFSHVQGFHRAFRRWTGQTPSQYREAATRPGRMAAEAEPPAKA
ncbi:MAG TPA: AraC family transcriptional regulator ligand-binding domain-containing protein [Polyangiales bacterium]|nr:AraC family transcriptional regulator ligand-binding domain-containing protein [Polyangiales bacterium]